MQSASDLAVALEKFVRPQTHPSGIQLLKSKSEMPPKVATARRMLRHKASLCQGFGLVRRNNLTFALFKEE
jgi:hypothetical protein